MADATSEKEGVGVQVSTIHGQGWENEHFSGIKKNVNLWQIVRNICKKKTEISI